MGTSSVRTFAMGWAFASCRPATGNNGRFPKSSIEDVCSMSWLNSENQTVFGSGCPVEIIQRSARDKFLTTLRRLRSRRCVWPKSCRSPSLGVQYSAKRVRTVTKTVGGGTPLVKARRSRSLPPGGLSRGLLNYRRKLKGDNRPPRNDRSSSTPRPLARARSEVSWVEHPRFGEERRARPPSGQSQVSLAVGKNRLGTKTEALA